MVIDQASVKNMVAVELKCYSNHFYNMNQQIQKYGIELAGIKKDIKEREDRVSVQVRMIESTLNDLLKKFQDFFDSSSVRFTSIEKSIKNCSENVNANESSCRESLVDFDSHKKDMSIVSSRLDLIQDKLNIFRDILDCKHNDLRDAINIKARILKDELKNAPTEIPEIKKNISDAVELMNANFSGVLDELRTLKHEIFLIQKHVEELFNKFARMK